MIYEIINIGVGLITEITPENLLLIKEEQVEPSLNLQQVMESGGTYTGDEPFTLNTGEGSSSQVEFRVGNGVISIANYSTFEQIRIFPTGLIEWQNLNNGARNILSLRDLDSTALNSFKLPLRDGGDYTLVTQETLPSFIQDNFSTQPLTSSDLDFQYPQAAVGTLVFCLSQSTMYQKFPEGWITYGFGEAYQV